MSDPIYTSPTDIGDVRRSLATAERNRSTLDTSVTAIQSAATALTARVTALETTVKTTITDNNYIMAVTDEVVIFKALTGNKTCTLPAVAASEGRFYRIVSDDGGQTVTVQCASGEFYGTDASNHTKYTNPVNSSVTVFSDGSKWWVVATYVASVDGQTFA